MKAQLFECGGAGSLVDLVVSALKIRDAFEGFEEKRVSYGVESTWTFFEN
jgi:hypothetical protein